MKTFCDNVGRTWTLAVHVTSVKRVRDLIKVDLNAVLDDGELLSRLNSDGVLLCDVVYCLCRPEAEAKQITESQFGEAMVGDAIQNATDALMEELQGFFSGPRRALLHKAIQKLRTLQSKVAKAAMDRMDSPELERMVERELAQSLPGTLSGTGPESSASTPARSPCAS